MPTRMLINHSDITYVSKNYTPWKIKGQRSRFYIDNQIFKSQAANQ